MSMKRFVACSLAAAAAAAAVLADEPAAAPMLTAAQVVERNAAARGGLEAWRKIETMAWAGHVESVSSGRRVPFVLEQKRPDRTRFEVMVDGQKAIRVFDGTDGWKVHAGRAGQPEVEPYTDDELRFARAAPVIDGPLFDYAARGATITLDGMQEIGGREAYVLALRLASGTSYRVWIDAESFLELRFDREFVNAQGRPAVTSVYFANYRAFEGLQVPLAIETRMPDGKPGDKLVIARVALNPHLDDRRFAKPAAAVPRHGGVIVDTRSAGNPARPARQP
jgi:outer membrane lipoprotein-sorting protein